MHIDERHLYTSRYFGQHYLHDPRRQIAYEQEAARVMERIEPGPLLDIGCGTGGFLEQFDPHFYTRYGVDLSPYAVEATQARGIWAEAPEALETFERDFFACVIMRGTLQHYQHPFQTLYLAYQLLKPGGTLAILATPNTNSLVFRLFGELPALDPPRNWWLPSDAQVRNVLKNTGFEVTEILYPYLGGPYANPLRDTWRFILRCFGIRKPFAFPGNIMEIYCRKP